jgi:hypothetical protein
MERAPSLSGIPARCIFVTAPALLVGGQDARAALPRANANRSLTHPRGTAIALRLLNHAGYESHEIRVDLGGAVFFVVRFLSRRRTVPRGIREALISAAALVALIVLLAVLDDRVRERFTDLAPEGIWDRIASQRGQLASAGHTVLDVITDHSVLTAFVITGSALVACMLRTT